MNRRSATRAVLPILVAGAAMFLVRVAQQRRSSAPVPGRPRCRVVVLGAGFGGLNAALALAQSDAVDLTVVDVQNHHLFQPLLYQVATAALSPADIASPVRDVIPALPRTHVIMGGVTGIDTAARQVICSGQRVPYDELIISTGSQPSYFGNDGWAAFAPGLKTLHDALDLRGRILLAFERACVEQDPAERDRLLTFVSLPENLSAEAARDLQTLGVEIRTGTKVTGIQDGIVHLEHGSILAATIVWSAGTSATPVAQWLGIKPGNGGRVEVGQDLTVPGHPEVRLIGDAALAKGADGKPLPGLAPVAKQQGEYAANAILRLLAGRPALRRFRYRDYGTMATIGRAKAVAEFGPLHLKGLPAWLLWAAAHIFFLIGFRSRVMVSLQWGIAFLADRRPGRLIAGAESPIDDAVTGHAAHR